MQISNDMLIYKLRIIRVGAFVYPTPMNIGGGCAIRMLRTIRMGAFVVHCSHVKNKNADVNNNANYANNNANDANNSCGRIRSALFVCCGQFVWAHS